MTVMDDFLIAPREQTGTPINFMEKEQQWLMNFYRNLLLCINKGSRIKNKSIRQKQQ